MKRGSGAGTIWGLGFVTLGLAGFLVLRVQSPALAVQQPPPDVVATPEPPAPEVVPIMADDHPAPAATHRAQRQSQRGSRAQGAKQRSSRF
jgi:hypothetical protein